MPRTKRTNTGWTNSSFIQSQGTNVVFTVSYPNVGNKRVAIRGEADIPTWFARFFGINSWHVWAEGDAESRVLDIAVVLDVSGSMCNHPQLPSFPSVESGSSMMSPGRATPSGGFAFPTLVDGDMATAGNQGIPAGGANSIVIQLNDIRVFTSANAATNRTSFGDNWNSTTPYWQRAPSNIRAGMILLANSAGAGYELMQITAVNAAQNRLTVTRARTNNKTGVVTTKTAHATTAEIWANRYTGANGSSFYCNAVSKFAASSSTNGPHHPFDEAVDDSKYFVTLFNSSYEKIGLASFSTTGTIRQGLTSSYSSINTSLDSLFYPDGSTNIAHGIARGRAILDGAGKRSNAVRVMVMLTDGIPNQYCTNGYGSATCNTNSTSDPSSCPASSNASISAAISQAAVAKAAEITVYTIGLGPGCWIASLTTSRTRAAASTTRRQRRRSSTTHSKRSPRQPTSPSFANAGGTSKPGRNAGSRGSAFPFQVRECPRSCGGYVKTKETPYRERAWAPI